RERLPVRALLRLVPAARRDGTYALAVPAPGPYVLAARAPGHGPLASPATHTGDGDRVDVDLALPPETVTA
ncbi:carboxypeptidase-like regulatory domain-containing protein, partial [Streptomyces albogriseolus]|uniref:carboxypeptidase-like regulatory domain-containing protein n=1 Tax=Streptomyces albogriseolus TaxID=1887 RepID=UPI0034605D25